MAAALPGHQNNGRHRSEERRRIEDWLTHLPAGGVRAMCYWIGSARSHANTSGARALKAPLLSKLPAGGWLLSSRGFMPTPYASIDVCSEKPALHGSNETTLLSALSSVGSSHLSPLSWTKTTRHFTLGYMMYRGSQQPAW